MSTKTKWILLICICTLAIGIFSGCAVQKETYTEFSPQCEKLSELSDQGILEFLRYYRVKFPEGFAEGHTDAELAQTVRSWIKETEKCQEMPLAHYNHTTLIEAFDAVCGAAVKHYGWEAGK